MNKLLALVLLAVYTAAGPTNVSEQPSQSLNCLEHDDFFSCICVQTISAFDKATKSNDIHITDGITFVRDIPIERDGKVLEINENQIIDELPNDNFKRAIKLFKMLQNSVTSFIKSHTLKFNMPENSFSRALTEGRAKIKKMILPLIATVAFKVFAVVALLFGGLSLLTLKALAFGKMAMLFVGIMAFQKLFGSYNGVGSFFNKNPILFDNGAAGNWATAGSPGLQHQGYRSFDNDDEKVDAHNLAYFAHAPVDNGTK